MTYNSNFIFSLNIYLITKKNNRVLSERETTASCTLTDITYINENNYLCKALCGGGNDKIEEATSFNISTSTESNSYVTISEEIKLNSTEMEGSEFNITNISNYKMINIIVDNLQKKNGWTNEGYSFVLTSKKSFNNTDENKKISLNIENNENNEVTYNTECEIPKGSELSSINCIAKNINSKGVFKIQNKAIFNNNNVLPEIILNSPSNKLLNIEENSKSKKLSKGAKIGIIVGVCAVVGISIAILILFKTGILSKGNASAKAQGYTIAPDKSRNIAPDEIKDNQSGAVIIKNQNDKYRK